LPDDDDDDIPILLDTRPEKKKLKATDDIADVFSEAPPKKTIHIIVQRPPPQVHAPVPSRALTPLPGSLSDDSRPGTPVSGEGWHQRVAQIENDFFAPDSGNYTGLVQFVKGGANIPTTGGTLGGLPFVLPPAGGKTNQPSLLFLNLPESFEAQDPPITADKALEMIRGRAIPLLPLLGVSGCGKTRTTIKLLSKNWGFYLNGSGTDWGSGDLLSFLELVQQRKRYQNRDLGSNTHVHILTLALVLSRVVILQRCLDIAERERTTFTCKHWMLLQFGFRTMGVKDLFAMLFKSIANEIHLHSINITTMSAFAHEQFSSLRQRLTFNTPSQRFDYKILLVIDEAQNLSKEEFGTFLSQQKYLRKLSDELELPLLTISADKNLFCVIPCGNGLSVFDMKWLEDSAPVPKVTESGLGHSPISKAGNRSNKSNSTGILPIVSAIERMIMPSNGMIDWRLAIKETEDTLSSTESRHYGKRNIVFDISRMIRRVHNFESRYAKYQNIRTTLKAFVLEHYLHGSPLLLNKEEAPLVEASVGRILNFGEDTATVLDEPFALRAAVNYFRRFDPDFHSAICTLLGSGSNASVHGHQWGMAVLPSLAHVFHDKILSNTDLVPKGAKSYDPILDSEAEIAGYVDHITLGTDFQRMSLDEFLDAHVHHGSRKDGEPVPPFYHPAETPSGPDVAFVLRFDNNGYCPVFVQLKMRHKITLPKT
ncbi:hypothetical protein EC991_002713, partial [Linnemannia zychae]